MRFVSLKGDRGAGLVEYAANKDYNASVNTAKAARNAAKAEYNANK